MIKILFISISFIITFFSYSEAETLLFFHSEPGDFVGLGETKQYNELDGDFNVYQSGIYSEKPYMQIVFSNFLNPYPISWILFLGSPDNEKIQVGRYIDAIRFPNNIQGTPGLSFSGDGRGCNELYGSFTSVRLLFE